MKITRDIRDYAARKGLDAATAIEQGMEEKAKEFVDKGLHVYTPTA